MNHPKYRDERKVRGQWAESAAVAYLTKEGYEIVARNWRCRFGEIDIIASYKNTIVFVEVRSRMGTRFGSIRESVDAKKQRKVRSIASLYLHGIGHPDRPVRCDVVLIQWITPPDQYELTHMQGVF